MFTETKKIIKKQSLQLKQVGRRWRAGREAPSQCGCSRVTVPKLQGQHDPTTASSVRGRDLGTPSSSQGKLCWWGRTIHPKLARSQPAPAAPPMPRILQLRPRAQGQAGKGKVRHKTAPHQQTLTSIRVLQSPTTLHATTGITESQNLGTTGWFRLEGTFQLIQFQPLP